jgi:ATP adenylyltransferase
MSNPLFHSYLTAPWKKEYVTKRKDQELDNNQCIFCAIAQKTPDVESWEIFRNQLCMVLLNKYPYNPGHLLLLPLNHFTSIVEIPQRVWNNLNLLLKRSTQLLTKTHNPSGFNIGMNLGNVAGASIKHLHWHVVPRYPGDLNFMEILHTRVMVETLDQTMEILKGHSDILKGSRSG